MSEANSKQLLWAPLIACASAVAVAFCCSVVRDLCVHKWVPPLGDLAIKLLLWMSVPVGIGLLATWIRIGAPLALVCLLSASAAASYGWIGSIAFALAGLAILGSARRSAPALMTYSVAAGALFMLCRFNEVYIDGLIGPGRIPIEHAALAQHVLAFTLFGVLLARLCGQPGPRSVPLLTTTCVLAFALTYSARALF